MLRARVGAVVAAIVSKVTNARRTIALLSFRSLVSSFSVSLRQTYTWLVLIWSPRSRNPRAPQTTTQSDDHRFGFWSGGRKQETKRTNGSMWCPFSGRSMSLVRCPLAFELRVAVYDCSVAMLRYLQRTSALLWNTVYFYATRYTRYCTKTQKSSDRNGAVGCQSTEGHIGKCWRVCRKRERQEGAKTCEHYCSCSLSLSLHLSLCVCEGGWLDCEK